MWKLFSIARRRSGYKVLQCQASKSLTIKDFHYGILYADVFQSVQLAFRHTADAGCTSCRNIWWITIANTAG